jgi:hypothetical protein
MCKNIDVFFSEDVINISKIGKYDKFIDFENNPNEHSTHNKFFRFTTNDLTKDKLQPDEIRISMINMEKNLDLKIESDLKEDSKLQLKIKEILRKADERIEKLRKKPLEKLKKKYGYENFMKYYEKINAKESKQETSGACPSSCLTSE